MKGEGCVAKNSFRFQGENGERTFLVQMFSFQLYLVNHGAVVCYWLSDTHHCCSFFQAMVVFHWNPNPHFPSPSLQLHPLQYCHTSYFSPGMDLPKSVVCVCSGHAHLVICVCGSPSLGVATGVWRPQYYKPPGLILPLWAFSECQDFLNVFITTTPTAAEPQTPTWWDFVTETTKL